METKWIIIALTGFFIVMAIGIHSEESRKEKIGVAKYEALTACYNNGKQDCSLLIN